jgi:beta-glucosidase-like glycosyl hydrolase
VKKRLFPTGSGYMCSYSSVNGGPSCAGGPNQLYEKLSRNEWNMTGYVVSDCQAVRHLTSNDTTTPCTEEPCFETFAVNATHGAAASLEGGTTIECDRVYGASLPPAIAQNLTSVATLKRMVGYTLKTLIQAGVMDPLEQQPYTKIGLEVVGSGK